MNSAGCVLEQRRYNDFPASTMPAERMQRSEHDRLAISNAALRQEVQAAIAANEAKSKFLATMSHEIRTPLNAMLGMLRLARETQLSSEQAEYLGLMHDAAGTLLQVVNGILDFSRIEAGELEIEQIPFSLRDCLADTLRLLTYEARQKGLTLNCVMAEEVPDALLGDPLRLRQIMVNLLGNAIKFTEHGEIVVRVALHAGNQDELACHFSVSDQGIGIAAEQQATIFSAYQQAEASTARCYGGSGLGLSIAAHLVDMMNGTLWLDSKPDVGSTFHFTACFGRQAVRPPAITLPAQAPAGLVRQAQRALKILLVEDNPINRRLAQLTLEQAGHRVVLAASGAAAQALLQIEHPDLILMDVSMPEMDGLQTTAAIRRREALCGGHVPIFALTAHVLPGDRERCYAAGMDDYLSKPLDPAVLFSSFQGLRRHAGKTLGRPRRCVVLDRRTLLLQVNGNLHLLAEIRDLFLRDCGPMMAGLRQALARQDAARFSHLTHTLRGMFCSLAAHAAQQVAAQMEELGMAHQRAALTFARLEHEVRMLKTDLLNMLRHGKVAAASSARTRHVIARETRLLHPARQGKPRRAWQGLPRFAVRQHERNFAGQSLGLHKGAVR